MQQDKPYTWVKEVSAVFVRMFSKKKIQETMVLLGVVVASASLLIWPEGAAAGVSRGLSVCAEVIVPSVFPFLVLTGFFVRAGFAAKCGRTLHGVMGKLFGLSGCCGAAVVMGAIGGYPAGAATLKELLDNGQIGEAEAKKALRFCVNGGPAFVIGTVGTLLLGSVCKGLLLYVANIAAAFCIGFAQRGEKVDFSKQRPVRNEQPKNLVKSFTDAVFSGVESVLRMCGFVMLFSAFLTLSNVSGLTALVISVMEFPFTLLKTSPIDFSAVYTSFWEIGSGVVALGNDRGVWQPFLFGAALGWGGVSVHCQNAAMFSERRVVDVGYWGAVLWHALLGGLLSHLLFQAVPSTAIATVDTVAVSALVQVTSITPLASVAMLLTCGVFLLNLSKL